MAELTDTDLAVLNQVLYTKDNPLNPLGKDIWSNQFMQAEAFDQAKTHEADPNDPPPPLLGDIVKKANTEDLKSRGDEKDNEHARADEWARSIEYIRNSDTLSSLRVVDIREGSSGSLAVTIMSGDDVYVLFKGTGSGEWPDNTQGIWATDTAAQLDAANYVRYVHERFGGNITVSGHSKGANKAMYATITTGLAKRCVAFDGQGFGKEFLARYQDEIGKYRERITAINLDNDFVSALMTSVAGTVKWARGNRVWDDADVLKNHSMGSLLTDEMAIDYVDGPGPVHKLVASLTEHILSTASDEHAHTLAGFLGIFLQEMLVKGKGLPDAWAEAERLWPGGGTLLLAGLASWEELEQFASLFAKDPRIKMLLKMVQLYADSVLASGEDDVQLCQRSSSGIVRDFSEEREQELLGIVHDIANEELWDVGHWDIWYRLGALGGGLDVDRCRDDIKGYWRRSMDVNDTKEQEIRKIFSAAREEDSSFAGKLAGVESGLDAARAATAAVLA